MYALPRVTYNMPPLHGRPRFALAAAPQELFGRLFWEETSASHACLSLPAMGSVMPSPPGVDNALVGWLGMVALEHGHTGAGAWLAAAASGTPPLSRHERARRRRRARTPAPAITEALEQAEPAPAAPSGAEEASARSASDQEQPAPERLLPRLSLAEWWMLAPEPADAPRPSLPQLAQVAAEALRSAPTPAVAAVAGAFLLLLARGSRRRRASSAHTPPAECAGAPEDQSPATRGEAPNADGDTGDDGSSVADGMLAPVLKGSALAVRENGQWLERVLMLRADNTLQHRALTGGVSEAFSLRGAAAAPVAGEPLCFTLEGDSACLLLRCRSKQEVRACTSCLYLAPSRHAPPVPAASSRAASTHARRLQAGCTR